ncbi:hypothetical protein C8035_v010179 [Colletotrichum spinosum]|uniref:Uncharacterized protein n=1 Tax=Colletotrichum spinosum TaxID=1347390 RepID=A0A4R8Q922_9PEZI|nr:hypothetical protein C8035_v010179 [Colletotrichum spinosum]
MTMETPEREGNGPYLNPSRAANAPTPRHTHTHTHTPAWLHQPVPRPPYPKISHRVAGTPGTGQTEDTHPCDDEEPSRVPKTTSHSPRLEPWPW